MSLTLLLSVGGGAQTYYQSQAQNQSNVRAVRYLGVYLGDVNDDLAKKMKLGDRRGAIVGKVEQLSPAAKSGMRVNDVIVSLNSRTIHSRSEFYTSLVELGTDISSIKAVVSVIRNGELYELPIDLGLRKIPGSIQSKRKDTVKSDSEQSKLKDGVKSESKALNVSKDDALPLQSRAFKIEADKPDIGITVLPLTVQLAAFLNSSAGVLVGEVKPGSPGDKAGIKAGDSIIAIDSQSIATPPDFYRLIRQQNNDGVDGSSKTEHTLMVIRDGKESKVQIKN